MKRNRFSIIIDILNLLQRNDEKNCVRVMDFIQVLLEDKSKKYPVLKVLESFDLGYELEEVLTLVIIKGKYSLTRKLINKYKMPFEDAYVKAALEYNKTDIVFLLRTIYPQNYIKNERSYIVPLTMSFEKVTLIG